MVNFVKIGQLVQVECGRRSHTHTPTDSMVISLTNFFSVENVSRIEIF